MTTDLPNTSYAVLGLLSHGAPLSGYEIRKRAQDLQYFYWSPAQSQIYSELRRLEKLDFVTQEYVIQEGKPNKKMYQISPAGTAAFQTWINTHQLEPTVIKHALALPLFFGHAAEPGRLEALIQAFIEQTEAALGEIGIVEEFTANHPDFLYQGLVAEWGRRHYEAELEIAKAMLERLQGDQFTDPTYWTA